MHKLFTLSICLLFYSISFSQDYTSYFTGNPINITTTPLGGICMMGGATEHDEAMRWFLQRSVGGDVLVLRASGSDGYNDYMYTDLGIAINSVETIVCNNSAASYDPYVWQKIQQAEAIWFAGGDQWDYVSYWRNTPVATLINEAITNRHIVIGGTSAGMAILGGFYFSAQNGTVSSATTLANPYATNVTVDSAAFIKNAILDSVITDTHYDNPDRRGRQITFLARMKKDWNVNVKGIACDEYTAVCIDNTGLAKVYGDYPANDDNAYFIQSNCEVSNNHPETVVAAVPLTWDQNNQALKVYNVKGTPTGNNSFNLNDWKTAIGGSWQNWFVINGNLQTETSIAINCVVIPVTLLDFTLTKDQQRVRLQWHTVTETNSSYFAVQKSLDGINFETIKKISAAGNSNQLRKYSYYDTKPFYGTSYYRLQQVDIDGKSRYSKTVNVNFNKETAFNIYPNPCNTGKLYVETNGVSSAIIVITDMAGQKLLHYPALNSMQQTLDLSSFKKGIYILKAMSASGMLLWTSKLIID